MTTHLTAHAPDLWSLPSEVKLGLGIVLPARMTVVRLPDGGLWVHSPVRMTDADAAALAEIGPVRHLVAPNLLHHLFLEKAQARFPEAKTWAPAGLAKKAPGARIDAELSPDETWGGAFEVRRVAGASKIDEWVFLHSPSRTLVVTDLVFNMKDGAPGVTGWVLRMAGTYGRLAQSRVWNLMIDDRPSFRDSVDALLETDFDRLLMAHGFAIEDNAREPLKSALSA